MIKIQVYDIPIDSSQKETTTHGTYEFPLALYETQLSKNILGFVNWHWHYELQFCYVYRGNVCFFVNQESYEITKGQGIFINSGFLHMARDIHNTDGAYICIDIDKKLVASFNGSIMDKKYVTPFMQNPAMAVRVFSPDIPWQMEILNHIKNIHTLQLNKVYGYEFDICNCLNSIWKLLIMNCQIDDSHSTAIFAATNQRLKEIFAYIHTHYGEQITLNNIAATIHISPNECCRFFKKAMNCTLFNYILDYRLRQSMELLQNSDLSISQIAYETGFGSTSYYIEKFRTATGITPNVFRHQIK